MPKKFLHRYPWVLPIAAVIILAAIPTLFQVGHQQTGSFEYVRKGRDLFDKGKMKESLRYFEKAYRSSPENKDIQSNLAYAYTTYGVRLADSGNFDQAIEFLKKAVDVSFDQNTIQNLAMICAKKAIAAVMKNNLVDARKGFETARAVADYYKNARKNLSILLHNEGVVNYGKGNIPQAIIFLKESSLTYENALTFEILGDIYYKKTDLEKARFYFGKTLSFDPQNDEVQRKLQKTIKELRLSQQEESEESPHFEIRYPHTMAIDTDSLRRVLEKSYFEIGKDLKYFPRSKTVVLFYPQDIFKNIFKMPDETRAFYDGNIRIPLPDKPMSDQELFSYIYHEYTHAVVSAKTGDKCPVWFSEGIAVWEQFKGKDTLLAGAIGRYIHQTPISVDAMDAAFSQRNKNEKDIGRYYLLSYTAVQYIIDTWGIDGLRHLLERIKSGRHVVNAIDDEFLLSEKEFEERWQSYVLKKYGRP